MHGVTVGGFLSFKGSFSCREQAGNRWVLQRARSLRPRFTLEAGGSYPVIPQVRRPRGTNGVQAVSGGRCSRLDGRGRAPLKDVQGPPLLLHPLTCSEPLHSPSQHVQVSRRPWIGVPYVRAGPRVTTHPL